MRAVSSVHIDNPNLLFVEFETNLVAVKIHVVSDWEIPLNP